MVPHDPCRYAVQPRSEGWQSGRMRRSRKPLSVVRRIEGSNPSPSAQLAESRVHMRGLGPIRASSPVPVEPLRTASRPTPRDTDLSRSYRAPAKNSGRAAQTNWAAYGRRVRCACGVRSVAARPAPKRSSGGSTSLLTQARMRSRSSPTARRAPPGSSARRGQSARKRSEAPQSRRGESPVEDPRRGGS